MSNTQQELPAGSVQLPAKVQARIQARLKNIQSIQEQATAAIQSENAFIVESIESFKDAVGVEGQFALLNDASYLVPHVAEEAITETHDVAPVETAERTHNNEGDKIGGDCPSETADVAEPTVAAEVGMFENEIAEAEQEVQAEVEAAPIAEEAVAVAADDEVAPEAV